MWMNLSTFEPRLTLQHGDRISSNWYTHYYFLCWKNECIEFQENIVHILSWHASITQNMPKLFKIDQISFNFRCGHLVHNYKWCVSLKNGQIAIFCEGIFFREKARFTAFMLSMRLFLCNCNRGSRIYEDESHPVSQCISRLVTWNCWNQYWIRRSVYYTCMWMWYICWFFLPGCHLAERNSCRI